MTKAPGKVSVRDLLKRTAGTKIYKSFREAMEDVSDVLEKQHFDLHAKLKRKAADANRRTR